MARRSQNLRRRTVCSSVTVLVDEVEDVRMAAAR
jgi:hypothetical protein